MIIKSIDLLKRNTFLLIMIMIKSGFFFIHKYMQNTFNCFDNNSKVRENNMKSYIFNNIFTVIKLFKSQFTKLYYVLFRLKYTPSELL